MPCLPRQFSWGASALLVASFVFSGALPSLAQSDPTKTPEPPGLGDPGKLVSIEIHTGNGTAECVLSGRDAGWQLQVIGKYDSGQIRDLTSEAKYAASPADIVSVNASGYATPVAEGSAVVVASVSGQQAEANVQVTNIVKDLPINFPGQVTPIFTKYGCNGGGCHGKSGGQNGFALSLLGFEPAEDFEHLVKEARGRRLFPAAPEHSLLLKKSTAELPHGGGMRIEKGSPAYNVILRWIEQGMPYGSEADPVVTGIEISPKDRLMPRHGNQQLTVIAKYSNGRTEDVTRMTQFDSNDTEMAEVDEFGRVTTSKLTGSVAVMARYQGHVDVFRATVPLGIKVDSLPPEQNYIDKHIFAKLTALGLPPSNVASDATFLRRVTVDIAGRIPTQAEAEAFLADADPNKREKLVDRLLDSAEYAEYFATKWSAILRNKRERNDSKEPTFAFYDWIRRSLHANRPYDEFVREVITATGNAEVNPPAAWYRQVADESAQVEDTAQLFLGMRIQCARCHHHPFEKWSQQDYYGVAAFFSQVGRKKSSARVSDRVVHRLGKASAKNPKTGDNVLPTGLGAQPLDIPAYEDPRHHLVDWMANPNNPFFAKALVNRYWKHFFSRGLVDPEDDMRVTNPATNPELLDSLAAEFIKNDFDLKQLVRDICNSTAYQLSAEPNAYNANDKQNFSRYYPKRLNAEVMLDAVDVVTGSKSRFSGMPTTTRAVELPDNGFNTYFLTVFGKPESSSACECERSGEANLAQSLHLLNSKEIQSKLASGVAADLSRDIRTAEKKIEQLYLTAFARRPKAEELQVCLDYLEKGEDKRRAFEDLVWALVNTKEFLFNH